MELESGTKIVALSSIEVGIYCTQQRTC